MLLRPLWRADLIALEWSLVLAAMVAIEELPWSWRVRARIGWIAVKGWASFVQRSVKSWLWFRTTGRFRAWRRQRHVADRERKALPIYIRCTEHKDFGGDCESDATWADVGHFDFPTHCDRCVRALRDETMKRVGPTERPKQRK